MSIIENFIFFIGPVCLVNFRVKVIVPSFSALFSDATFQKGSNESPLFCAILLYKLNNLRKTWITLSGWWLAIRCTSLYLPVCLLLLAKHLFSNSGLELWSTDSYIANLILQRNGMQFFSSQDFVVFCNEVRVATIAYPVNRESNGHTLGRWTALDSCIQGIPLPRTISLLVSFSLVSSLLLWLWLHRQHVHRL